MQRRPGRDEPRKAFVVPGFGGFRYILRGEDGREIYYSPEAFRSRRAAREAILRSWPGCKVSFEVM